MNKLTLLVVVTLALSVSAKAQQFYNYFEEGTLEGWTHSDGSSSDMSIQNSSSISFLQKLANGSSTPQGALSIVNNSPNYWAGNYWYNPGNGNYIHTIDDIGIRNTNNFDLYIRFAFEGANGVKIVTTDPIIVQAQSDWNLYGNYYGLEPSAYGLVNLTVVSDTSGMTIQEIYTAVSDVFEDVVEFKVLHNEDVSYDGAELTGSLEIESIFSYELLSVEDRIIEDITVYPNPVKERFTLSSQTKISNIKLYSSVGSLVLDQNIGRMDADIDLSQLNSGVYLLEATLDGKISTTKIVKL